MFDVTKIVQPHILDLQPYRPGMPIQELARKANMDPANIIKLASNENPLGPSPLAREAAIRAATEAHRYPDGTELRLALAAKLGVQAENIVLGNGSNDVLDLVARTFLAVDSESVSSQHAFTVYQLVTKAVSATNVIVPATDFGHDLAAMQTAITDKTRVVWIANPNNPTGTLLSPTAVRQFIEQVRSSVIVVLDEAYFEYLTAEEAGDTISLLAEHPNLVITRTFSKIYGLGGMRIGYAIANAEVAGMLNRIRQPFNVSSVSLAAASAALADQDFVGKSIETNIAGRRQLTEGFIALGLNYIPSHGNFVTVRFPDASAVNEHLLQQGIIVRPIGEYGMPDYLRVSVGLKSENARLLDVLGRLKLDS